MAILHIFLHHRRLSWAILRTIFQKSMQASQGSAHQGGRGKRGIMAEVAAWRQKGQTEKNIRDKPKARNYPKRSPLKTSHSHATREHSTPRQKYLMPFKFFLNFVTVSFYSVTIF